MDMSNDFWFPFNFKSSQVFMLSVFLCVVSVSFHEKNIFAAENDQVNPIVVVAITPLKSSYRLDDPIGVIVSVKNVGTSSLDISYLPNNLGISFEGPSGVEPVKSEVGNVLLTGGAIPRNRFAAGEMKRYLVVLNQFVNVSKVGELLIDFKLPLDCYEKKPGDDFVYTLERNIMCKGKFTINIAEKGLDEVWLNTLEGIVNSNNPLQNRGYKGNPEVPISVAELSREDAVRLLASISSPLVESVLMSAAKKDPILVGEVISYLGRRLGSDSSMQSQILELALISDASSFQRALKLLNGKGVLVDISWFKPILSSGDPRKIWISLEYIKMHGKFSDRSVVEPVTKNKNKNLSDLAYETMKVLESRK